MNKLTPDKAKTLIESIAEDVLSVLQWIESSGISDEQGLRFAYMHLEGMERTALRGIGREKEEQAESQAGDGDREPDSS